MHGIFYTKKPPKGDFLICCVNRNAFAARGPATVQNVATALGCHARAKTMRANTTCFWRLICSFCCHFKSFCAIYLIICFTKKQIFYLLFINPSFSSANKIKWYANNAANKLQNGKNIILSLIVFMIYTVLQIKRFVNMIFLLYFLTPNAKICYLLYAINQGKVKLCQKLKIQMK